MAGTVRPLGDRVVVRVVAAERKSAGGVILPDQAREQSDRGLVVAVGPGTYIDSVVDDGTGSNLRPVPVQEDEIVLFSPYAGTRLTHGNDDFLLLREHDILGVLDGAEAEQDPETGEWRVRQEETARA